MVSKIEARNFKGTRDYLPNEMIQRNFMVSIIRKVFEKYGFVPLETPAIEYLDILMGKYGEEGDKLIYKLDYKGGSVAGMKYDLTLPLARVIAQYKDLTFPFKRYQIQPVWRADRPQPNQGRFREFYQCDADIIGSNSIIADAEIIAMTHEILDLLNIGRFVIRINHRKILMGITEYVGLSVEKEIDLCRAIDKLDKIGMDGVKEELATHGFSDSAMEKIINILSIQGDYSEVLKEFKTMLSHSETGLIGVNELDFIFNTLINNFNIPRDRLKLDLYLARGLDYYTGAIYESNSLDLSHIGSLTGGGRYDRLVGSISGNDVPAVGATVGLDRIYTVLNQLKKVETKDSVSQILVTIFNETMLNESIKVSYILRKRGFNVELFYDIFKLKKQFSYADKKKIPYVVVIGPDEAANGKLTIKDLLSGTQEQIDKNQIINYFENKITI
ncbi:MAG: histidine--tRNA ligase [Spirochaetota bacterium]|nr:histidine--tRNA ligase [Spirochaetota bacterium]